MGGSYASGALSAFVRVSRNKPFCYVLFCHTVPCLYLFLSNKHFQVSKFQSMEILQSCAKPSKCRMRVSARKLNGHPKYSPIRRVLRYLLCVIIMTARHGHLFCIHDDVIKWKKIPHYWPFVRGIHRSPVTSPHKGQWRGALMFSLICVWINGWVNNHEAGDLRRYRAHYGVIVMYSSLWWNLLETTPYKGPIIPI